MSANLTQALPRTWTATELRKLTPTERDTILEAAAKLAENDYRTDKNLTAFEAFGEKDLPVRPFENERFS